MARKQTKARRGKKGTRRTRRNGRKMMKGSGMLSFIRSGVASGLGMKKLEPSNFEKSFTAVRKPLGFSIYTLTFLKTGENEGMKFDFSVAGNDKAPTKEMFFNSNKVKIINGLVDLFNIININKAQQLKNLLNNAEQLKLFTRQSLTMLNTEVNDIKKINAIKEMLTSDSTGREMYFSIVPEGKTSDEVAKLDEVAQ